VIVNELLQWTVLVVLMLLTLGVLRQVSLLQPRRREAEAGPPTGRPAPSRLVRELKQVIGNGDLPSGAIVAFVAENCPACQRLIADVASGRQKLNGQPLVLVARSPSEAFGAALDETAIPLITDQGALWEECHVTATPLVLRIDAKGKAASKEVTHRVDAVADA
jgi:hypothetical protein